MAEYKHIIILKEILQNGGYYMVLIKRITAGVTAFALAAVMQGASLTAFSEGDVSGADSITKAAIVTEVSTGQVLYEHNSHERLPMASVTKLMCLLIWAEEMEKGTFDMETVITATARANAMDGSVIWLNVGEEMSAYDMIRSVIIASANDACVAVCEYITGTEEMFVERMNKRAQELGMSDTHYDNCVGFDSDTHYTSAYDTALLSAAVSEYDCYNEFFATRLDYVREGERQTQLLNTNKLMQRYDGIIGGKTGTTDKAGCCLAVWAKRGNMKLCAVALGCKESEQRFSACTDLLNYGFSGFELYRTAVDSDVLTPVTVTEGLEKQADIRVKRLNTIVIPKGSSKRIEYTHTVVDSLSAPVQYGEKVGEVRASLDGEEIFYSDIVTTGEVGELNFFSSLLIIIRRFFSM